MASQALPLEEAVQILQDAGCTREFTQRFIAARWKRNRFKFSCVCYRCSVSASWSRCMWRKKVGLFGLPAVCAGKAASC